MMSGRIWRVRYTGQGADMVRRDIGRSGGAAVRCGGAGALWRATIVEQSPDGNGPVVVELWPLDPHAVDPTVPVLELVMPSEVVG